MSCNACDEPKVWKNGEKFYWKSQNQFAECVAKFCREGRNAGKPGPCPKDNSPEGGKSKSKSSLLKAGDVATNENTKARVVKQPKPSKMAPEDAQEIKANAKSVADYNKENSKLDSYKKPHLEKYNAAAKKIKDLESKAEDSHGMTPSRKKAINDAIAEQKAADGQLKNLEKRQDFIKRRLAVLDENKKSIMRKYQ